MMKLLNVLLIVILFIVIAGCTSADIHTLTYNSDVCNIKDFGNGVLFFGCDDYTFASSLSSYIGFKNVTIISVAPVPYQVGYNSVRGYIVVTKNV